MGSGSRRGLYTSWDMGGVSRPSGGIVGKSSHDGASSTTRRSGGDDGDDGPPRPPGDSRLPVGESRGGEVAGGGGGGAGAGASASAGDESGGDTSSPSPIVFGSSENVTAAVCGRSGSDDSWPFHCARGVAERGGMPTPGGAGRRGEIFRAWRKLVRFTKGAERSRGTSKPGMAAKAVTGLENVARAE